MSFARISSSSCARVIFLSPTVATTSSAARTAGPSARNPAIARVATNVLLMPASLTGKGRSYGAPGPASTHGRFNLPAAACLPPLAHAAPRPRPAPCARGGRRGLRAHHLRHQRPAVQILPALGQVHGPDRADTYP